MDILPKGYLRILNLNTEVRTRHSPKHLGHLGFQKASTDTFCVCLRFLQSNLAQAVALLLSRRDSSRCSRLTSVLRLKAVLVLSIPLLWTNHLEAEDFPFPDHIKIQYQLTGTNRGTEELFIHQNKIRSITHVNISKTQTVIAIDLISLIDGAYVILADLNQKRGMRFPNSLRKAYAQMNPEELRILRREVLAGLPKNIKQEILGHEEILGRDCEIIQVKLKNLNLKLWIWNDLILKSEISGAISFNKLAISIDLNTPLSNNLFEIPANLPILEKSEEKA